MSTPHDSIVKAVFGLPHNAVQYFRAVLPAALVERLDLDRAQREDVTFTDRHLGQRRADLLYGVPLAEPRNRDSALVYVLFEHQSSVDPLMAFRLLRYLLRVWEYWLAKNPDAHRLPLTIPLVLYNGPRPWTAATRFQEVVAVPEGLDPTVLAYCPDFHYRLHELAQVPDENLPGSGIVRLILLAMKHIRDPDLARYLWRCIDEIRQAAQRLGGLQELASVVEYILIATDHVDEAEIAHMFGQADESAGEVAMSVADRLREEGMKEDLAKGWIEGLSQGRGEGQRESTARCLPTVDQWLPTVDRWLPTVGR